MPRPDKLSVIVFSGAVEKVHYALATAAAAAAIDMPVTLFFTMEASRALEVAGPDDTPGWHALAVERIDALDAAALDARNIERGVAGFEELLQACSALDVKFMVCEMGLAAIDLDRNRLRDDIDIEIGGLVTFLNDASANGTSLFI